MLNAAAYGFRIDGGPDDGWLALRGAERWPVLTLAPDADVTADDQALVDWGTLRAGVCAELPQDEIVHPVLGRMLPLLAEARGIDALHGGALLVRDAAWAVIGAREAGKSSLLAQCHRDGAQVATDDIVVLEGMRCLSGPRCIDLRAEPARRLGPGIAVRGGTKHRIKLPPAAAEAELAGVVYLAWGPGDRARRRGRLRQPAPARRAACPRGLAAQRRARAGPRGAAGVRAAPPARARIARAQRCAAAGAAGGGGMSPERLARAYRTASTRRDRLWTAANGCFDGLWLGFLDRPALARLDEVFYTDGHDVLDGKTFAYTGEQHNLGGLQDWEAAAIEAHFPPGARVVVTGAGGGREVIALLERGFDAVGYEPNPALVAAGSALLERRGHPGRLQLCERDAFPADVTACDAIVLGWGSYMLIPGRARRLALLQAARRVLPAQGPLLCSFFMRPAGTRYFATVAGTANLVRRVRRAERAELGDAVGPNFVHSFTRAEIQSELAAAGFRMAAFAAEPYGHAVATAAEPGQAATPAVPVDRINGTDVARLGQASVAVIERGGAEPEPAAPAAPPLLELEGITKRWPRLEHPVLDRVDLVLERGSTTLIGGRNGIGKTTLLRIATGLIGADAGAVTLDGLDPFADRKAFQARTGFLSASNGGLYARLTVQWHLDWWARLAFLPPERRRDAAEDAVRRFGLRGHQEPARGPPLDGAAPARPSRRHVPARTRRDPARRARQQPRRRGDRDRGSGCRRRHGARRGGAVVRAERDARDDRLPAPARARGRPADAGMKLISAYGAAMTAVVRRDLALYLSYRMSVLTQIFSAVFSVTLFYYMSRLVTVESFSPDRYFEFVLIGLVILQAVTGTVAMLPIGVRQELVAGTFERLALSPFGAVAGVLSMIIFPFLRAIFLGTVMLVFAMVFFGLRPEWPGALLAFPVAALGALAFTPFSLFFTAAVFAFKQAPGTGLVLAAISLLAGLYFPVALLPDWIEWTLAGPAVHPLGRPAPPRARRHRAATLRGVGAAAPHRLRRRPAPRGHPDHDRRPTLRPAQGHRQRVLGEREESAWTRTRRRRRSTC